MAKVKTETATAQIEPTADEKKLNETKEIVELINVHRTVNALTTIFFDKLENTKFKTVEEYYIARRKSEVANELNILLLHELKLSHNIRLNDKGEYVIAHEEVIENKDVK